MKRAPSITPIHSHALTSYVSTLEVSKFYFLDAFASDSSFAFSLHYQFTRRKAEAMIPLAAEGSWQPQ
jgi:hypothetical protein